MRAVVAGVFAVMLAGCSAGMTSGASRTAGDTSGCDADDFARGRVVFFGITNNLGPGTIMKEYAGNGVGPEVLLDNLVGAKTDSLGHPGVAWPWALGDSVARGFSANSAVESFPASASD